MQTLSEHYRDLLGLNKSWRVIKVDLELEPAEVWIHLESTGVVACCSGCGKPCPLKDHAPERQWRHLDTMQFTTTLLARVPRTKCGECGVKTCSVPWAEPHGRYTLMFEAFAATVRRDKTPVLDSWSPHPLDGISRAPLRTRLSPSLAPPRFHSATARLLQF